MWFAEFADVETSYIAVGKQKDTMGVFQADKEEGRVFLQSLPMKFPGCLRFLEVDIAAYEERSMTEIEKEYGVLPASLPTTPTHPDSD